MSQSAYVTRLDLPSTHAARMLSIIAVSAGTITAVRSDMYRARFRGKSHLRIFCGKLIVATLERKYIWLALDEDSIAQNEQVLASLYWDEKDSRPNDAKGKAYPRYKRPASRNAFYDPASDPKGHEWPIIERAHHLFLRKAAEVGMIADHRTKSDPGLEIEIAKWRHEEHARVPFDEAIHEALKLGSDERRSRLLVARKKPLTRVEVVVVFDRNADVVAEVLLRADGVCELCKNPAPFMRASDETPYLEVHHCVRLADGGEDTVENAIAVCPNCHRRQHYG